MDNFALLKTQRVVFCTLLEQEKVVEAANEFDIYINNLLFLKKKYKDKRKIDNEISYAQSLFEDKIINLCNKKYDQKDYVNSLLCYTTAFKYNITKDITFFNNYLDCLNKQNKTDIETEVLEHLELISSNYPPEIYKTLAVAYDRINDNYKSTEYYEKYLKLIDTNSIESGDYNYLGCYYNKLFSENTHSKADIEKSIKYFEKAYEKSPNYKTYAKNVTIVASKINDQETCRKYWEKIFEMNCPLTNDDKYDYAAFCLKIGNFEGWHKYFGFRFQKENNKTYLPEISKPEWNGKKDITGKTLLIHCEQGFGDTFLMWGYMPRIINRAKHIIFIAQDELCELLQDNNLGIEVLPKNTTDLNKIKFDYYIPSMSIPAVLKLNRDNISVEGGYIQANKQLTEDYKKKYFNNDKLKIGISIAGGAKGNHTRDIPINTFLLLDKLKNVEIYSLSYGFNDSLFTDFKNNKVINVAKDFHNFSDTAAAIANCDVIITADNGLMNLAGAMGKKTFCLFNYANNFRYFDLTGEDIVWYKSVKPFVCNDINNWEYAMEKAIKEL